MSSNKQWSVQAIIARIEREKREAEYATTKVGYSVRGLWSCYADPGILTAAQAHTAMQWHLECGVATCRVRSRARTALVAAGRMVLDSRAARTPSTPARSLLTLLRTALFGYTTLFLDGRHAL
ncbi:hypothetical protein OHB26_18350 [Nocardia sp. NBC_01503]|uniref:hypothetical protein n=1 Tax=Nocardia sp. NBC_01503 TaxID=2975997 RepID=UPI002E7BDC0C|nr:hypothetical protein [Nocardia sp. NBC_01503]WTL35983.1 hypothetical protein OHB26_18350 [Nocardia sp. NBC_01503]